MKHAIHLVALTALILVVGLTAAEIPNKPRQQPLPVEEFYKHFEKVPTNKETGALFAPRVFLGTAGDREHYNSLTLGWGACGVLWTRPVAIVYIHETRFSHAYFEAAPIFTLSWYGNEHRQTIVRVFGGTSGRHTDKEKTSGFTPVETPDGGVTYLEAEKVVVCRKVLRQPVPTEFVPKPFEDMNKDGHVHIQYTGEVLSVWKRK